MTGLRRQAGAWFVACMVTLLALDVERGSAAPDSGAARDLEVVGSPVALNGVTAIAHDDAWVVGCRWHPAKARRLFIAHWDGASWASVPPNGPGGSGDHCLRAVDATGTSDVWAVGDTLNSTYRTLAEHWDGTRWTVVDTPDLPGGSLFTDVTAVSPVNVWAVGLGPVSGRALVAHWDGERWSEIASPARSFRSELTSVSSSGPGDIWAVGNRGTPGRPFAEHWNGVRWQVSDTTDRAQNEYLDGVATLSDGQAWAVGWAGSSSGSPALLLHWDGAAWSRDGSGPFNNQAMHGVDAVSADDVWAVGGSDRLSAVTAHWDGSGWAAVSPRHPGRPGWGDVLSDVSAASSTDVWAVGVLTNGDAGLKGLIEHWNGQHWSARY